MPRKAEYVKIVVFVTPDQRRKLKVAAASENITMSELIRRMVEKEVIS